ncbi:MAG: TolC family protein, partial [Panacagrimonas sp.]
LEARQALLRFDWFSKLARGTAKEQLAEVHYRNQEIAFIARVTQRYLETMLAEDQVEQIQAEAEAVRQSLEDTRLRYEVELVPGVDLKEAQARDDLVQAQKIAHINQLEAARDALQEVTGYDRGDLPSLKNEIQLPPLEPTHVDDWVEIGMRRNTDVLEARLLAVIAESEVDSKRAQGRPRLDLVASTGRSDSSEYELGSRQDESQIGLELEVPLYGGGRLRSQVRQAQARAEEARIRVQRVEAQSERQLRLAFRDVQAALAADRAYVQVLRSAQAAAKAVDAGYTAGTRTIADVLDAKSSVVNAKRDRNEVRYNLLTKLLGLLLVAGTLSVDDILELDYLFDHSSTNSTAQTTP